MGDKIEYTLTVKNDDTATVPVENGVITDVLPAGLTFEYGSVTLNGKNTNDYTYDENTRLLTVNVGTIEPDAKQIIGFTATVNRIRVQHHHPEPCNADLGQCRLGAG